MGVLTLQSLLCASVTHPHSFQNWVTHQDSLTEKLRQVSGSSELELLVQGFVRTDWWARTVLDLQDSLLFQREIMMRSHGVGYWYARTLIPQHCFNQDPAFFNRLYRETMRELIFNEDRVRLMQRIAYPVDNRCLEFYWAKTYLPELDGILWLRVSDYSFQELARFYLIEIFLPPLEHLK